MAFAGDRPLRRGSLLPLGMTIAAIVLVLDQASKWYVLEVMHLAEAGRIAIAPFVDFVLVWNTGISYGLFSSDGETGRIILAIVAFAAAGLMIFWLSRETLRWGGIALGLLIGGAIGNGIDRIVHGAVVDFVLLHGGGFEWYVFNVSDAAIVVGVVLLLVSGFTGSEGRKATA